MICVGCNDIFEKTKDEIIIRPVTDYNEKGLIKESQGTVINIDHQRVKKITSGITAYFVLYKNGIVSSHCLKSETNCNIYGQLGRCFITCEDKSEYEYQANFGNNPDEDCYIKEILYDHNIGIEPQKADIKDISSGDNHTLLLDTKGRIFHFGRSCNFNASPFPILIETGNTRFTKIVCEGDLFLAKDSRGYLWSNLNSRERNRLTRLTPEFKDLRSSSKLNLSRNCIVLQTEKDKILIFHPLNNYQGQELPDLNDRSIRNIIVNDSGVVLTLNFDCTVSIYRLDIEEGRINGLISEPSPLITANPTLMSVNYPGRKIFQLVGNQFICYDRGGYGVIRYEY